MWLTTANHTQPHSTTFNHTQPHSTTPNHTQPHPTTLNHSEPQANRDSNKNHRLAMTHLHTTMRQPALNLVQNIHKALRQLHGIFSTTFSFIFNVSSRDIVVFVVMIMLYVFSFLNLLLCLPPKYSLSYAILCSPQHSCHTILIYTGQSPPMTRIESCITTNQRWRQLVV